MAHDNLQELIDLAFDDFDKGKKLAEIDQAEREAFLLGTINYQVENGGFQQWIENGYAYHINIVMQILKEIGKSNCLQVSKMLIEVNEYVSEDDAQFKVEIDDVDCSSEEAEVLREELREEAEEYALQHLNSLDEKYYEINENVLDEIEQYFQDGRPKVEASEFQLNSEKSKPKVKLLGEDGNAFFLLGKARNAYLRAGYTEKDWDKVQEKATSGDYNHLLVTLHKYFEVC